MPNSRVTPSYMNCSDNISGSHSVLSAQAVSTNSRSKTAVPSPGKIGFSAQKQNNKGIKGLEGINVSTSGL